MKLALRYYWFEVGKILQEIFLNTKELEFKKSHSLLFTIRLVSGNQNRDKETCLLEALISTTILGLQFAELLVH